MTETSRLTPAQYRRTATVIDELVLGHNLGSVAEVSVLLTHACERLRELVGPRIAPGVLLEGAMLVYDGGPLLKFIPPLVDRVGNNSCHLESRGQLSPPHIPTEQEARTFLARYVTQDVIGLVGRISALTDFGIGILEAALLVLDRGDCAEADYLIANRREYRTNGERHFSKRVARLRRAEDGGILDEMKLTPEGLPALNERGGFLVIGSKRSSE